MKSAGLKKISCSLPSPVCFYIALSRFFLSHFHHLRHLIHFSPDKFSPFFVSFQPPLPSCLGVLVSHFSSLFSSPALHASVTDESLFFEGIIQYFGIHTSLRACQHQRIVTSLYCARKIFKRKPGDRKFSFA